MIDQHVIDALNSLDATETSAEALPDCLTTALKGLAGLDPEAPLFDLN